MNLCATLSETQWSQNFYEVAIDFLKLAISLSTNLFRDGVLTEIDTLKKSLVSKDDKCKRLLTHFATLSGNYNSLRSGKCSLGLVGHVKDTCCLIWQKI